MDEKSLKPQLRFKGFADAWEQRKFQDIFSFERPDNYIVKSDKYSNEYTMPVLTANKAFVLGYTKENSPCTKTSLIFDDFTLECKYVDFPYMVKSSAIKILTVKDSKKDNLRFSFERLNTTKIEILGHARHYISVVQPTETRTPEIAEQNKISAFFSNLDNLITLHQRKLDKLSNVKKALLEKMFPKNDSDVPEIRFKGFTDAWEQRKFKSTIQIERGGSPRPIEDYITNSENGLNWIKIGDAPSMGKYITKTAEKIKPEGLSKTREVHPGDLILSNSMSFGRPYIMAINGCIHDGWLLLRNDKNLYDLQFLCHLLGSENMLHQYKSFAAGSTVNNLNKDLVGNTTVSFPKKTEQSKLGAFFDSLDNLITLHQRKLEKLKNIKKACLEKMFV